MFPLAGGGVGSEAKRYDVLKGNTGHKYCSTKLIFSEGIPLLCFNFIISPLKCEWNVPHNLASTH